MPKITKHAEFLDTLRTMMTKQANGPTATGKPGADTHPVSVSDKHDHVDKNSQGRPEKNPQDFNQKPSTDGSEPSKPKSAEEVPVAAVETKEASATTSEMPDTAKSKPAAEAPAKVEQKIAEEAPVVVPKVEEKKAEATPAPVNESHTKLAALGADLVKLMEEMQKQANGPTATGKPGADTHPVSVSDKHDHVDKNNQGRPEKNPQDFDQKPSKDKSEPSKPKSAEEAPVNNEEVEKLASFELGRQFARSMLKQAQAQTATEQVKTAGRRDFEQLIAQAAAELEQQEAEKRGAALFDELALNEKQAEEAGAAAFNELYKVAQYEYALTIAKQAEAALTTKLAAEAAARELAEKKASEIAAKLAEKEAALNEKIATEKRASEMNAWANVIMDGVVEKLQREASHSSR